MLCNLNLLRMKEFTKYFTQISIDNSFTRTVVRSVVEMIPSGQVRSQVSEIDFQMGEKVNILSSFKGTEGTYSSINR